MNKEFKIKSLDNNSVITVSGSVKLLDAAKRLGVELENPILGAMVNNRFRDINYEFKSSKAVQFIDITNPEGMRVYVRSLTFLLYAAVEEMFPGAKLRIEHSVSKGYYFELDNLEHELSVPQTIELAAKMRLLIERDIPFVKQKEEPEELIKLFEERGLHDKGDLIRHRGNYYSTYYGLENHVGLFYGYLVPSTGYLKVFELNKYYNGLLLRVPKVSNPAQVEELVVQDKLFEIFREYSEWNKILNITKIGDLNNSSGNGKSEVLIKVSESLQEKKIAYIADRIAARKDKLKIVLISGPSSSGKTTFSKRLAIQMLVVGIKPKNLSLDNYFVNRENTPRDENGDYNFEALEALDLNLFNEQLVSLLAGEEVTLPKFSFETGQRTFNGEKMSLGEGEILIIEGIHGLNPKLTRAIPDSVKFKVYVSALTSIKVDELTRIHTTDNRLIRRIVRDYKYRGYSARDTISRWASVRRGEEKYIFPYQEEADVMFNTALLYELAVLKPFAEPILLEVKPCQPEYSEASRLLKFFGYFKPMLSREIPPTSILREFFGGSSFSY